MTNALLQSQVFFFISSIGFILLGLLVAILLLYLIRISITFSRIIEKLEKDIDKIGDATKDVIEEVRDSAIFHFLFKRRKKHHKR